jgi:hypothetical protein
LIAASSLVHGVYNLQLIASYRYGEFNQVYPVARGTSSPAAAAGRGALWHSPF